jgi:hypothetical protein
MSEMAMLRQIMILANHEMATHNPVSGIAAALPLIALSALSAWRSLERLYTAYPITHGHSFSDDLGAGHIKVAFEIGVWCLVMGISAAAFLFLRFWQRTKYGR